MLVLGRPELLGAASIVNGQWLGELTKAIDVKKSSHRCVACNDSGYSVRRNPCRYYCCESGHACLE